MSRALACRQVLLRPWRGNPPSTLVYQLKRYGERELDHSHSSISSVCVIGERVGLQGQRAGAESIAANLRLLTNRKLFERCRMQPRLRVRIRSSKTDQEGQELKTGKRHRLPALPASK
jgi:hypothetical protein